MQVMSAIDQINKDPELLEQMKTDPKTTLTAMAAQNTPALSDTFTTRLLVAGLVATVLTCILGSLVLSYMGKTEPSILMALGTAALTGLAGVLGAQTTKRE